jgi:hypothetical protein
MSATSFGSVGRKVPRVMPNPLGKKDLALTNRMSVLGKRSWEARKKTLSPEAWSDFCRRGARAKAEKMRQARQWTEEIEV